SLGALHDLEQAPALGLGERARLLDANQVAHVCRVLLVVGGELGGAPHDFPIQGVANLRRHPHHDRLVHRVGHDGPRAHLPPSPAPGRGCRLGLAHVASSSLPSSGTSSAPSAASASIICSSATSVNERPFNSPLELSGFHSPAPVRVMKRDRMGSLCAARRMASRATISVTPESSNMTRPGRTTATHASGLPLPEPMRVSGGFFVMGLSGKMLIHTLPPRRMWRGIATRAASICRLVIQPGSSARRP